MSEDKKKLELAMIRTKLANQRTLLLFVTTGFALAAVSRVYKYKLLGLLGVVIIILSAIQYIIVNNISQIEKIFGRRLSTIAWYWLPAVAVPLSVMVLYLHFYGSKKH